MKFNCGNCGEIDYVIIDGYGYGDRLLEGVTFEVRRDDEGKYHAQVEEFSRDYFAQFNQQMYLTQIEEGMSTEEFAICPQCGEEVMINKLAPRPVFETKMHTIGEILGGVIGTAVGVPVEDVGDKTYAPAEEEEEETSSAKGGDSGGGGASEELEPEKEEDDSSEDESNNSSDGESDDSSDDSSDDNDSDSSDSDES